MEELRRSRRFADEEDKKSGRERIQRAAVTDASQAEDAASHCNDVVRGPALWLVDREESTLAALANTLTSFAEQGPLPLGPIPPVQAIPSATG